MGKSEKSRGSYSDEKYGDELKRFKAGSLRKKLFTIIFGTDTPAGKLFDVVLLLLILVSVLAVMLESVNTINDRYGKELRTIEWIVTAFFTVEYIARAAVVSRPRQYIFSFFGIIDLVAILPSYLSLLVGGAQGLAIVRALRLLRVFRILKLVHFVSEAQVLGKALKSSRYKIIVFFLFLLILVFIFGTLMYLIEGSENGFHSIPLSIYWAIVTLTTVGFGDITPQTVVGQFAASIIMLLGYAIIAIPTGIVGAEIYKEVGKVSRLDPALICPACGMESHLYNSKNCHQCGHTLTELANNEQEKAGKS